MTARKMRNLLFVAFGLSVIATGTLIYFATDHLRSTVKDTTHRHIDAELMAEDLNKLHNLASILEKNQAAVVKAAQIVSDSTQYRYQDQIIRDVDSYANQSGITVTGYNFGATGNTSAKSRSVGGVNSITVSVNLESPMPYRNYLRFLKLLEQNISKMQVTGISLSPDTENLNMITNPVVGLIVYVR